MGSAVGAEKSAATKCGCSVEEWRDRRQNGESWCYSCREWKAAKQFMVDRSRAQGRASICKPCNNVRSTRLRYRLSIPEYDALRVSHCPICRRPLTAMVIDHCHKTGKVRAGLCSRCNVGIGLFCDDPALLRAAIDYLEKHRG